MKPYKHLVMTAVEVASDHPDQPTWQEGVAALKAKVAELEETDEPNFTPLNDVFTANEELEAENTSETWN